METNVASQRKTASISMSIESIVSRVGCQRLAFGHVSAGCLHRIGVHDINADYVSFLSWEHGVA